MPERISPYTSSPTPAKTNAPITEFRGEYRFLSNFWFAGAGLDAMVGPTVEHVFQAAKTLVPSERGEILAASTPLKAKSLGRTVTLRPDWEDVKLGVMAQLQSSKYAQHDMAQLLIATGDAELVEGNHWCDTFWGRCLCRVHGSVETGPVGHNWLGRILMIQRSVLRRS